jgi:hypothetical protein
MEAMSTSLLDLDTKRYGRLLAKALPAVVKSEDENDRMLASIESLMAKGEENLSAEENALLDLLVDLVHDFEQRHDPFPSSPPHGWSGFFWNSAGCSRAPFIRCLERRAGFRRSCLKNGRSARRRPRNSPHSSTSASSYLSDAFPR